MSVDRAHRLWKSAGLQVPRKHPPVPTTSGPSAIDFVFDTCADGRQLKCLTVVDEWTRECLAIEVASGIRAGVVVDVLARLVSVRGAPRHLRSDNGPEFVSKALVTWMTKENVETAFIDPEKPWQNGTNESFNGRFRDECLGTEWFRSRREAKALIETWRRHYNDVRPHSITRSIEASLVRPKPRHGRRPAVVLSASPAHTTRHTSRARRHTTCPTILA